MDFKNLFDDDRAVADTDPEGSLDVTSVTVTHETGDSIAENNLRLVVDGATAYGVAVDGSGNNNDVQRVFDGSGDVTAGTSVTIVAATSEDLLFGSGTPQYDPDASSPRDLDIQKGDGSTIVQDTGLGSGDTVRVVWSSDSGGSSATLGSFTLP